MNSIKAGVSDNPWLVLAIISCALLPIGIDMTVLNVALPRLTQELGATNSDKLWMVNAYSLVMAGLLPGFGALADKIGHRTILLVGMAVFGFSSLMAAFSPTPGVLIAARGMLAVGAAMILPATISIVRLVFLKDQERATAIGIWGGVWSGSAALGPILGGLLLSQFWWGSVFLINVPLVIVTFMLTLRFIPHLPGNKAQHWDFVTSAFLTVSLIGLLYALKGVLKVDTDWIDVATALGIGLVFGWLFLRRQAVQPSPLVDFGLFRNPRFSAGVGIAFVATFGVMGLQYVISQELQLVRGLSPLAAGLFVLPLAIASFVSGLVAGRYMLSVGISRMMSLTVAATAVGFIAYRFTGHLSPTGLELTVLALIGFGAGGAMAVASTAIMISAPEERAGMAGSIESISYELGGTMGVAILGSVLGNVYTRSFSPPPEADLPLGSGASLEQAIAFTRDLPPDLTDQVVHAGRTAYLSGVSASLTLASVVMVLLLCALLTVRRKTAQVPAEPQSE